QAPRPRVRSTGYPSNLPAQVTSFVGRDREIAEINQALPRTRLLTLTGSGGCGKTRLGLQVATGVRDSYADGVWLAELASLSNSSLVPKAVASALGIPEQPRVPLTETLKRHLRAKSLLLVLDNCEHLLAACAQLADALLRACPNLSILATSRESLGIAGELTYRVPGLSLPDRHDLHVPRLERLSQFEALRLFVERASFRQPGFVITESNAPAVVQVCSRLDGIPLAIELAAATVKGLSVEQIASRLDDRFRLLTDGSPTALPRHQTLRATMDWSYSLLTESERVLLRRVSVFAGGFTLEAAERICSGDRLAPPEVLELMLRLVDRSMVIAGDRAGQSWYRLLETVRQYAWERLVEADEADEMRQRHLTWYLALGENADSKLRGQEQQVWLERLETEYDNLRAALEWSQADGGGAEKGLRLAAALFWFWQLHGHWSEGRRWLEATNLLHGDASSRIGAKAVRWAALLAVQQGDFDRAADLAQRGLTLARNSGDNESLIWCRDVLGQMAQKQGNYARAAGLFEDNLDLCRQLNDQWLLGHEISWLGFIARDQRDYARAAALHTEALALFRKMGDKHFT
ncbi:MAG TPA: tetratricopeptide repeat protein, partial [Anaerolineales bacterium]